MNWFNRAPKEKSIDDMSTEELTKKLESIETAIRTWEEIGDENPGGQSLYQSFREQRTQIRARLGLPN